MINSDNFCEFHVGEYTLRLLRIINIYSQGTKLKRASRQAFDVVYYSDLCYSQRTCTLVLRNIRMRFAFWLVVAVNKK